MRSPLFYYSENLYPPKVRAKNTPDGVQLIFLWFIVNSERKMEFRFGGGGEFAKQFRLKTLIVREVGGVWSVVKKVPFF